MLWLYNGMVNRVMVPSGVMRPIAPKNASVTQILPAGPSTSAVALPCGNSVTTPAGVILLIGVIAPVSENSLNQRLPSEPSTIVPGSSCRSASCGKGKRCMLPVVVIRTIAGHMPLDPSVNQRVAPGPVVISNGWQPSPGMVNSVSWPVGVRRPIRLPAPPWPSSVNQRLPSGPDVILSELYPGDNWYLVTAPAGVNFPIASPATSANQRLPSGPGVMSTAATPVGKGNVVT